MSSIVSCFWRHSERVVKKFPLCHYFRPTFGHRSRLAITPTDSTANDKFERVETAVLFVAQSSRVESSRAELGWSSSIAMLLELLALGDAYFARSAYLCGRGETAQRWPKGGRNVSSTPFWLSKLELACKCGRCLEFECLFLCSLNLAP